MLHAQERRKGLRKEKERLRQRSEKKAATKENQQYIKIRDFMTEKKRQEL